MPKETLRSADATKRALYKPILETPYSRPSWPDISSQDANILVDLVSSLLTPIGRYKALVDKNSSAEKPDLLDQFVFGFNETHAALEAQARQFYGLEEKQENPFVCLIVCRSDIKNPLLLQNFPMLSATSQTKLIQLPKGTSAKLSASSHIPRLTVLAVRKSLDSSLFHSTVEKINPIKLPWLSDHPVLQPMVIRKLKTVDRNDSKKKSQKKNGAN